LTMKIQKKTDNQERRILIGMIVDSIVLGRIKSKWHGKMFKSKYANTIAKWCLSYYGKYNKAPMKHIESLFNTWSSKTKDESTVDLVSEFLNSLSAEYEELKTDSNSEYLIDIAATHFNLVRMERLVEDVENDITNGQSENAHSRLAEYTKIEMGVGEGIDVLQDEEAMRAALEFEEHDLLINYPGELGKFFMNALERSGFISFLGKKGVGKSFWLMDMAYRAMLQRKRVAYFEVGDMGKNQTIRRLMIRASERPRSACDIFIPTKIYKNKNKQVKRNTELKEFTEKLSWRKARKACRQLMQKKIKSKDSHLKLSCHYNSTLSVDGIEGILQDWERGGWIPDIIVIDYADILRMDYPKFEGRDAINETWKRLRSLSQRRHCLVITATQSDANSYNRGTMKMDNFSDDRRKIDSVTGMIGINQTEQEKSLGIIRLNWVSLRDDEFHPAKCIHVAGCLAIANPAIKSCY